MEFVAAVRLAFILLSFSILCGCSTLPIGKAWGEAATISPGWDKISKSAYNSMVSPLTWLPVAGAAIVQIDHMDHRISTWAAAKTPVFGTQMNANNWSNYLLYTSGALYGTTALLTPGPEKAGAWLTAKMSGFIVSGAAFGLSEGAYGILNPTTGRLRPNGRINGFPSGHATAATSFATLTVKNIDSMQLPRIAEIVSEIGVGLIAAGTGWSRVEANKHYPSDVLIGMALGHFLSSFVNDAFLGLDSSRGVSPSAEISRKEFLVSIKYNF